MCLLSQVGLCSPFVILVRTWKNGVVGMNEVISGIGYGMCWMCFFSAKPLSKV